MPISRRKAVPVAPSSVPLAGALLPGMPPIAAAEREVIDPALVAARRCYLDAVHIPTAILAVENGAPCLLDRNGAFDRIMRDERDAEAFVRLADAAAAFLADTRERTDLPWHQARIGGRHFRAHLSRLPALAPHDHRAMLCLVDRTAEVETARSLRAEMLLDSLTGLPNRSAFDEAIDAAISEDNSRESFAILALDISRFSQINECVGALAGDELIITVARRLVSALRAGDMLARLAGNEFGALVRLEDGSDDALRVARRLRAALGLPIRLSDLEISVDCAVGCAMWNNRSPTSGDLIRNAQLALKRAKKTGQIEVYEAEQIAQSRRRFSIETELRRAVDKGELGLVFQPLVDLATRRIAGFEALARWHHPLHGWVSPTEFIAVAEDCGLIVPLGRWALDTAMRTLARWDRMAGRELPLRMAVNVSAVQLARDDLAEAVAGTLGTHGIAGSRLTLELTESSIVGDPERASRVLGALHEQGAHVAMDDFGTGFSSLAALQRLPIDILKIDRSFVTDMHVDRDSVAIIRAILSLAQALGMTTTAEGIEDAQTAATLAVLGCTRGQGYYFARPLDEEAAFRAATDGA